MFYFLGRFFGLFFMYMLVKPMRIIYGSKKCNYIYNDDVIHSIQGKSFLIVSNHIKPRNKFLKFISVPYDAFFARHFFLQFGIYSTALGSYDAGKVKKGHKINRWKKNKEAIIKGILESMDVIPLNRNENDKTTSMHFKNRIAKGNLGIGMFPEGTWYRGFRKNRKIFPGAAVFARRYNLPILPIYLIAYNLNGKLELRIGELISNELSTEVISQKIREEFNRLYELNISKGDLLVTV